MNIQKISKDIASYLLRFGLGMCTIGVFDYIITQCTILLKIGSFNIVLGLLFIIFNIFLEDKNE